MVVLGFFRYILIKENKQAYLYIYYHWTFFGNCGFGQHSAYLRRG